MCFQQKGEAGKAGSDKNRSTFCVRIENGKCRMENGKCAAVCHKLIFINSAACLILLRIDIGLMLALKN